MKPALITGFLLSLIIGALLLQNANQRTTIAERNTEIEQLKGKIETQNHAIDALKAAGNLETSKAAGRVTTVLLAGERAKRNLPKGVGPKVMNQFMQAVFK
jgi:hypothetical protein